MPSKKRQSKSKARSKETQQHLTLAILLAAVLLNCGIGCSKDSFFSSSRSPSPKSPEGSNPQPTPSSSPGPRDSTWKSPNIAFRSNTATGCQFVWLVILPTFNSQNNTYEGTVYYKNINQSSQNCPPDRQWTYQDPTHVGRGTRTYVVPDLNDPNKNNLFFARPPGHIYTVNPTTPATTVLMPIWSPPNPISTARGCLTSYLVGGSPFLGIAWTNSDSHRVFTQFVIESGSSNLLTLSGEKSVIFSQDTDSWGYSCFVDQARNYFYSTFAGQTRIHILNLNTLSEIPINKTPNAGHGFSIGTTQFNDPADNDSSHAYVISGDKAGNLFRGSSGLYTFAQDVINNNIFVSLGGGEIFLAPGECFSTRSDCNASNTSKAIPTDGTNPISVIGPMSALSDGQIVGLSRGATSQIYLLSGQKDVTRGISATRIGSVPGNTYMYSDFTGATVYQRGDLTYDLTPLLLKSSQNKLIEKLAFDWISATGKANPWEGLILQVQCFKGPKPSTVQLTTVTGVQPALTSPPTAQSLPTHLEKVPTCAKGDYDHIRFLISQAPGASQLSKITQIIFYGWQD